MVLVMLVMMGIMMVMKQPNMTERFYFKAT
jgi:hypothetical protein